MKSIYLIIILLTVSLLSANNDNLNLLEDIENFTDKRIYLIQKKLSTSINEMRQINAKEAIEEIKNNILLVQKIHKTVKDAHHIDDVISYVAETFQEIASSYSRISDNKNEIFKVYDYKLE